VVGSTSEPFRIRIQKKTLVTLKHQCKSLPGIAAVVLGTVAAAVSAVPGTAAVVAAADPGTAVVAVLGIAAAAAVLGTAAVVVLGIAVALAVHRVPDAHPQIQGLKLNYNSF
jgi:hypothetical protein